MNPEALQFWRQYIRDHGDLWLHSIMYDTYDTDYQEHACMEFARDILSRDGCIIGEWDSDREPYIEVFAGPGQECIASYGGTTLLACYQAGVMELENDND